jgi:hydroxyethylthiazole kinase-like uncharacterized protein yjeF
MNDIRPTREYRHARPTGVPTLPRLPSDAHKGDAGRLLLLCGSDAMPGAALLAARAAVRAGAGLVTLAGVDRRPFTALPTVCPEVLLLDLRVHSRGARETGALVAALEAALERGDYDACAAGPGLGATRRTAALVQTLLERFRGPLLLDADGLNVFQGRLAELRRSVGPLLLTPHPGEAQRLLGRPIPHDSEGRQAAAVELAGATGATVLLKGFESVICDGERRSRNSTGNPALASGGSGDVLTGIAGAYLARQRLGWLPFECLRVAAWVHGRAADVAAETRGERGTIPSDLIDVLPAIQRALEVKSEDPERRA